MNTNSKRPALRLHGNARSILTAMVVLAAVSPSCRDSHKENGSVEVRTRALAEPQWQPGTFYRIGDLVQFNAIVWECRQDHTSATGWEPAGNYSLWQRPTPTAPGPTLWEVQVHYVVGSDVSYGGSIFECITEHVSQADWAPGPATASLWRKVNPGAGICTGLPDGSLCDDGRTCNVDTCQAGACVGSAATCGGAILATGTDVGTLPGQITVDPSGTANYSVPLWTPEGRNGMTPGLSLVYSSTGAESEAGVGWSVAGGMSMISRCAANSRRDARPRPVNITNDTYCLDGKRLVPVPAGVGLQAEYRTEPESFVRVTVAQKDPLGPKFFTVYTPDGLIHTYGPSAADSDPLLDITATLNHWFVEDPRNRGSFIRGDNHKTGRLAWLRGSVRDRYGNHVWFRHINAGRVAGGAPQEPLLDKIEYVDGGALRTRVVQFNYTPRTTTPNGTAFISGMEFSQSKLLTSIEMKVAPPGSSTYATARFYRLTLEPSPTTKRAVLKALEECDGNPNETTPPRPVACKKPTTFTYDTPVDHYKEREIPDATDIRQPADSPFWRLHVADVNHDGRDDLIYRARRPTGPATDPPHWWVRLSTIEGTDVSFGPAIDLHLEENENVGDAVISDLNSDGFPDIAVPSGANAYAYFLNAANGTPAFVPSTFADPAVVNQSIQIGDFFGKGRPSLLRPVQGQNQWSYRYLDSLCNLLPCDPTPPTMSVGPKILYDANFASFGLTTFGSDIDGDGVAELLGRDNSGLFDSENYPNYLVSTYQDDVEHWTAPAVTTLLGSTQGDLVNYVFLDHNGDGLLDALRLRQGESQPELIMNNGDSFAPPTRPGALAGTVAFGAGTAVKDMNDSGIRVLDYDADGKDDILLVDDGTLRDSSANPPGGTQTTLRVLLSREVGYFETRIPTSDLNPSGIPIGKSADGPTPPGSGVRNYRQTQVLDANGDDLPDFVLVSTADTLHLMLRQGAKPDTLVAIKDGMGARASITYLPMSDPRVYALAPGSPSCSAPRYCSAFSANWLVSSFSVDNGRGSEQNTTTYNYENQVVDREGNSVLGFVRRKSTESATNTTIEETFDYADATMQVMPKIGLAPETPDGGAPPDTTAKVYPFVGLPQTRLVTTTVTTNAGNVTRSTSIDGSLAPSAPATILYEFVRANEGQTYYVRLKRAVMHNKENGVELSRVVDTPIYDEALNDYGLTSGGRVSTTTPEGQFIDLWSATYAPDPSKWLLGRKTSQLNCSITPAETAAGVSEACEQTNVLIPKRLITFTPAPDANEPLAVDIQPGGPADERLHVEYVRVSFGLIRSVIRSDATGGQRTDTIIYDSQSVHPLLYTNALGHISSTDIDPALSVTRRTTDANGITTSYDHDTFGRLRRVNYPGGGGVTLSYARELEPGSGPEQERFALSVTTSRDGGGQQTSIFNRLGQQVRGERRLLNGVVAFTHQKHNALGLLESVTRPAKVGTPEGAKTTWTYDELGRVRGESRPEQAVDGNGNPISSATIATDYSGLITTFTDEVGRVRRVTTNALGRVVKSESRNDAGSFIPTEYEYGPFGVLGRIRNRDGSGSPADGRSTVLQYDSLGRTTLVDDPDRGVRKVFYNGFGDIREERDGNNSITTYVQDALGRVTSKTDKDGTTAFTWDSHGLGRLAESLSPDGVRREFYYDSNGRAYRTVTTVGTTRFAVDLSFDAVSGAVASTRYPDAATGYTRLTTVNVFSPDSGELTSVKNGATGAAYWNLAAVEIDGTPSKETFGNGVVTDYGHSGTTGRVSGIATTLPGASTPARAWTYAYLPDGNLQRRSDTVAKQHERFEYDDLGRIKRWLAADKDGKSLSGGWSVNYTIDDFGNLTRRKFNAGPSTGGTSEDLSFVPATNSNRLVSSPWGGYTHDPNGNQITRPGGEGITYTAFDLPKSITGPRAATFEYDATGIRVRKKKTATDYTVYIDGIYEKRVNGSTVDHTFYVLGPGGPVAQVMRREGGNETVKYLHADRLGSIDAVTEIVSNVTKVVESTKRDPYGNRVTNFNQPKLPSTISAPSNKVRLGFTGHEQDDELGMINMRGRLYDPRLGRFVAADPVVADPMSGNAFNRYSYVANNPLQFVDRTGYAKYSCDKSNDQHCTRDTPTRTITPDDYSGYQPGYVPGGFVTVGVTEPRKQKPAHGWVQVGGGFAPARSSGGRAGKGGATGGPGQTASEPAKREPPKQAEVCYCGPSPLEVEAVENAALLAFFPIGMTMKSARTAVAVWTLWTNYVEGSMALGGRVLSGDREAIRQQNQLALKTAPIFAVPLRGGSLLYPWAGPTVVGRTQHAVRAYRLWGGETGREGAWLTLERPTSRAAAQESLALPPQNSAEFVSPVDVPARTLFRGGKAGPLFHRPGGACQIKLLEEIPKGSFGPGESLQ